MGPVKEIISYFHDSKSKIFFKFLLSPEPLKEDASVEVPAVNYLQKQAARARVNRVIVKLG